MSGEGPWITAILNYDGGDELRLRTNVGGGKEEEMRTDGRLHDAIIETKDRVERRCRKDGVTVKMQVTVSHHETKTSMDEADWEQAHLERDLGGESDMSEAEDRETDLRSWIRPGEIQRHHCAAKPVEEGPEANSRQLTPRGRGTGEKQSKGKKHHGDHRQWAEYLELLIIQAWRTKVEGNLLEFLFGSVRPDLRQPIVHKLTVPLAQLADDLPLEMVSQSDDSPVRHVLTRTLAPYLQWSACLEEPGSHRKPPSQRGYLNPHEIVDLAFFQDWTDSENEEIEIEAEEESSEEDEEVKEEADEEKTPEEGSYSEHSAGEQSEEEEEEEQDDDEEEEEDQGEVEESEYEGFEEEVRDEARAQAQAQKRGRNRGREETAGIRQRSRPAAHRRSGPGSRAA
ncbi:hypothetical protein CBR_g57868 [Chara braunii]|uniref:Uncharacterized protein n=1 Tax=Chara braunii TaxID=69332 RepID=A0A388K898_CHABU|nr:hypothetical protein CBR_g57868 [Chara braunii]|eukprot:GBG66270.1 hypothetical protein CBR_g57868 [Chara braunii]